MSEQQDTRDIQIGLMEVALAIRESAQRFADALERLADAYLYCNAPEEEGEESRPGQSLSDVPASLSER